MKLHGHTILLVILVLAFVSEILAGRGAPRGPKTKLETAAIDHETGQVALRLTVEVRDLTKEIAVIMVGDSRIVPDGRQEVSRPVGDQSELEFLLPLSLNLYDTVGVKLFVVEKTGIDGFYSRKQLVKQGDRIDTVELGPQQGDEISRCGGRWFIRLYVFRQFGHLGLKSKPQFVLWQ